MILDAKYPESLQLAAELIKLGQLVAFPTDTVYGVGADFANSSAIEMLYTVKNRPHDKGIPILLASVEDVDRIARDVPPQAASLMKDFWPGPLTLILLKRTELPDALSPNQGIAVRVPDNEIARSFIRMTGGAIAATSANLSGAQPARTAQEAHSTLANNVGAVLDGGPVQIGVASTILDFTSSPPRLVREGPLTMNDLIAHGVRGA